MSCRNARDCHSISMREIVGDRVETGSDVRPPRLRQSIACLAHGGLEHGLCRLVPALRAAMITGADRDRHATRDVATVRLLMKQQFFVPLDLPAPMTKLAYVPTRVSRHARPLLPAVRFVGSGRRRHCELAHTRLDLPLASDAGRDRKPPPTACAGCTPVSECAGQASRNCRDRVSVKRNQVARNGTSKARRVSLCALEQVTGYQEKNCGWGTTCHILAKSLVYSII